MENREYLQKSSLFKPLEHNIQGWCVSEKLDGLHCFWDGGITREMRTLDVPWASVVKPYTKILRNDVKPYSTGLWRNGNVVEVPEWFLDQMPTFPCDGIFNEGSLEFAVFSTPPWGRFLQTGIVSNDFMHMEFHRQTIDAWLRKNVEEITSPPDEATFEQELFAMLSWKGWTDRIYVLKQILLPKNDTAVIELQKYAREFIDKGAKSIMLRNTLSNWTPKVVDSCLEFKLKG